MYVFFVVFKFAPLIFIIIIEGCSSKSSDITDRSFGAVENYKNFIVFSFALGIVISIIFMMYF